MEINCVNIVPYLTVCDYIQSDNNNEEQEQLNEQIVPQYFLFLKDYAISNINITLEIENENDFPVALYIFVGINDKEKELISINILNPGSNKIDLFYLYRTFSFNTSLILRAYRLNGIYNISDRVYFRTKKSIENILYNRRIFFKPYYDKLVLVNLFHKYFINPRIAGIVAKMYRNSKMFFHIKNAGSRYQYYFSVKIDGIPCPFCGIQNENLPHKYLFVEKNIIQYNDNINPFCTYCLGTGYYGAFNFIQKTQIYLTYGKVIDPEVGIVVSGNAIISGEIPVKAGDYIWDGENTYIIQPPIEIRSFYNIPIWYRTNITNLSPLDPIIRVLNNIVEENERKIITTIYE